jgi:hypothetical protein
MSLRKVQDTIVYLEKRGLIKRLGANFGGPAKGSIYYVPLPAVEPVCDDGKAGRSTLADNATIAPRATVARAATVARGATNKDDDDELKLTGQFPPISRARQARLFLRRSCRVG